MVRVGSRSSRSTAPCVVVLGLLALVASSSSGCSSTSEPVPEKAKRAAPNPLTISFPSVVIPPNVEKTECVVVRLGNSEPLHVGSVHNVLGDTSHHLIVYRVSDTVEQTKPFECRPFTDTLDPSKGAPLMVTQKRDDTLTLPPGVGYTLDANQMIRLEIHYINASSSEKSVQATSTMVPIPEDDYRDEASFLFIGNPDIRLPPRKATTLGPTFFQIPYELFGVKFFAITGHEHRLGTNVQIAVAKDASDPGRMVYDVPNWSWSEPKTEVFETPLTVPNDGGFRFTCSWNNTTDDHVGFGESAHDEMCFFWAYYYPSQGSRVCVHTNRAGGEAGTDLCCPGDLLCAFLNQ